MSPQKRQRLAGGVSNDGVTDSMNKLIDGILKRTSGGNAEMADPALRLQLIQLQQAQRSLYDNVHKSSEALLKKRQTVDRKKASLAALRDEEAHLQQQIQECKDFSTPHLLSLAESEATEESSSDEAALQAYFGVDIRDTEHRDDIIDKLHQEINQRGDLAKQLKAKQEELQQWKTKLREKEKFLKELPDRVDKIERASLPLQKYMQQIGGATARIGSERASRLKLAESLPPLLYTLFQTLQHYLDQDETNGTQLTVKDKEVWLRLSVESAVTSSTKYMTIRFGVDESSGSVVARATSGAWLFGDVVLDHLCGNDCPPSADGGRPYRWANYLAGQHDSPPVTKSCRVILQELHRRLRANSRLHHILKNVDNGKLVQPPNVDDPPSGKATFQKQKLEDGVQHYQVNLTRKNGGELTAGVEVDLARYPVRPPRFSLNQDDLYDVQLAQLEERVNEQILKTMVDDEDCHWILVYQLRELMKRWLQDDQANGSGHRTHRGRDRVPIES